MTRSTDAWHVPDRDVDRYVAGTVDPISATSIESHVVACSVCQRRVGEHVHPVARDAEPDATWLAIADAIDRPTATRIRLLGPLERRHPMSAVAFGSPALRWSGALALAVVLLVPLVLHGAGLAGPALTLFFVLAPLLPLAGIAACYSTAIEPVGELAFATPARTVRLLAWRGSAVLAISLPVGVLAAVPFAVPAGLLLGWVLPALALCALTLAAATWRDPVPVAVGLAGTWAALVLVVTAAGERSAAAITNDLAAWAPAIQIVSLVAIAAGVAVAISRRDTFEHARFS